MCGRDLGRVPADALRNEQDQLADRGPILNDGTGSLFERRWQTFQRIAARQIGRAVVDALGRARNRVRQSKKWFDHLLQGYAGALGALAVAGGALMPLDWLAKSISQPDLPLRSPGPGHPEVLDPSAPMTAVEQQLWADLETP
ncbi:DUF6059 family protein [Streptomyces sp. NPDC003832]